MAQTDEPSNTKMDNEGFTLTDIGHRTMQVFDIHDKTQTVKPLPGYMFHGHFSVNHPTTVYNPKNVLVVSDVISNRYSNNPLTLIPSSSSSSSKAELERLMFGSDSDFVAASTNTTSNKQRQKKNKGKGYK